MDPITLAIIMGIIGTGASMFTGMAGNYLNQRQVQDTNQANKDMTESTNASNEKIATEANQLNDAHFQQEMAWNQYVQQQTWEREDNQYQRRIADLTAAGLSPLALANTSYSAGQTVSAPQSNPAVFTPNNAPNFMSPQFDFSSLLGAITSSESSVMQALEHKDDNLTKRVISDNELTAAQERTLLNIDATKENIKAQLASAEKIADEREKNNRLKIFNDWDIQTRQIEQVTLANAETKRKNKAEEYYKAMDNFTDTLQQQFGTGVRWHVVKDSEYDVAWNQFVTDLAAFNEELAAAGPDTHSEAEGSGDSSSNSSGWSADAKAGVNGIAKAIVDDFGAGLSKNKSTSNSTNSYKSTSDSYTTRQQQLVKQFWTTHQVPVRQSFLDTFYAPDN